MLQPTSYLRYEKRMVRDREDTGGAFVPNFIEVKVLQQWWFDTDYGEADPSFGRGVWLDIEEVYE